MNESVVIILPIPDRALSPNRPVATRLGRMLKAKAVKTYREAARAACEAQGVSTGPWKRAAAQDAFYWPTNRNRDIRNAEAMLKPAYDGIVDAGLLVDDNAQVLEHQATRFEIDRVNPRVEITIWRKDDVK